MTGEMAAFYRRMLSVGFSEPYQRDVGLALETENPLSDPHLDLAFCLSDTNKTISILDRYMDGRTLDEAQIYAMILAEMRQQYVSGSMSLGQVAKILFYILESADLWYVGPWEALTCQYYEYEEAEDGWINMESFLNSFAEYLLAGKE